MESSGWRGARPGDYGEARARLMELETLDIREITTFDSMVRAIGDTGQDLATLALADGCLDVELSTYGLILPVDAEVSDKVECVEASVDERGLVVAKAGAREYPWKLYYSAFLMAPPLSVERDPEGILNSHNLGFRQDWHYPDRGLSLIHI